MRNYRLILTVGSWLVLAASLPVAAEDVTTEPFVGVRVIHSKSMTPRQVDMWVAEIDPHAPGIEFMVTPSNGDLIGDTKPETTRAFVTRVGAQIGINGSFFAMAAKGAESKGQYEVLGLSASKGDAYSPFKKSFTDAINISKDNVPTIIRGTGKAPKIARLVNAPSPDALPKGDASMKDATEKKEKEPQMP